MDTSFVPLRLRSNCSLLYGLIEPGAIPMHLRELGFGAGALVDENNLYGAIEFYQSALANGIKPIIGAEVRCERQNYSLSVIALTRKGYSNLCRIITARNRNPDLDLVKEVIENSEGIAVLSTDPSIATRLAKEIGEANVWVEVVFNRPAKSMIRRLLAETNTAKLKAVATWEVVLEKPKDELLRKALVAIRNQSLISHVKTDLCNPYLEACLAMPKIVGDPDLLKQSLRIADMVDLDLELGKVHFPKMRDEGDSTEMLRSLCLKSLPQRYPRNRLQAEQRLDHEIETISMLGFADYFLCVKKIVDFARAQGIAIAGRGSGASSIVAYLLGITQVDPIREKLCFERFLNRHRPDYPDIDLDIAWDRRDEVISFVYREFGKSRVAMVSTRVSFETHSALGSVAKAFGLLPSEIRALTKALPQNATEKEMQYALIRIRPDLPPRIASTIASIARELVGIPNHTSIHCGGMVIADTLLTDYTPLEIAPKGIEVTQFDMESVEKIGLIKIDLLGNRALAIVVQTKRAVGNAAPLRSIIGNDKVKRILETGATITCFQLESPAMRTLLKMLRARSLDDLTLALALVRPGPSLSGAKSKVISDRQNQSMDEKNPDCIQSQDQCLIYEEDVMKLISQFTGLDLAEADILRRLIKKDTALAEKRFAELATKRGLDSHAVKCVWEKLERFASYTFCKAHAASYARLAYITAALKANYPAEFYAAALSNHCGMYPLWVHINEARRIGVPILLPDVNLSDEDFKTENGAVRTGLGRIKFVAKKTIESIIKERRIREFKSLTDFLSRIDMSREEAIALIGSGALDSLGVSRPKALLTYFLMKSQRKRIPGSPLLDDREALDLPCKEPRWIDLRRMEYEFLGFSPLVHPIYLYRDQCQENCDHKVSQSTADQSSGERIFYGLLAALHHHRSGGSAIWFVTLDNPEGIFDCIASDKMALPRLEIAKAYRVRAIPIDRNGALSWRIQQIEEIREGESQHKIFLDQIGAVS